MGVKLSRLSVPTAVFFAIAVVSVGWVAFPLGNYTRFYLALWNFDYTLSNITLDMSQPASVQVGFELLVSNPTSYSGLSVSIVRYALQYFDGKHDIVVTTSPKTTKIVSTNWWDLKAGTFNPNIPVPSQSNKTITFAFKVNPSSDSDSQAFLIFLKTSPLQIVWSLECDLVITSFLAGFGLWRSFSFVTPMSY